ncbi:MAG: CehA/McbA family metallohydrolase [Chloroflexota bacterium]
MGRDYRALDLGAYCNVDVEHYQRLAEQHTGSDLEERLEPPVGRQRFRGLPMQIGLVSGKGDCFIAPGLLENQVLHEVPVGRKVMGVIVAHVLLGTDLWEGAPFGREVARYLFHSADDTTVDVPIRERLEIGNIPLPWGQYPLLCVPDRPSLMMDQHVGAFVDAGFRQAEIRPSSPAAYFLWFWRNPRPDIPLRSISIIARMQGLIIAGITLSHVPEDPLRPRTRRTARILVDTASDATTTTPIEVRIDRGLVTYPQPLPPLPLDEGLPGYPGWGALASDGGSSAYVDIAALPSAIVTVSRDRSVLGRARWKDIEAGGHATSGPVRIELIDPGRNWVQVTVVDEATGQPVPCRIAFQTPEGVPYAPHGHHSHVYSGLQNWNVDVGGDVKLGQVTYAYIDGTCEGWLPRGPVIVDVARGFEYEPLRVRTTIVPGQRDLRLSIGRWVDMNASGWYSGDTHVHFLSGQGALREAAGEDLNVVNLLQAQWAHMFANTEDFTGQALQSADRRHMVWVSQENREHILGHLGLLGLKRPVMPWSAGGPGEGELGGAVETTTSRWADAAHAQGAMVVLSHFPTPNAEAPVLVATGRADAVEMFNQLAYEHIEYYRYLNDGYRLPLVAGTDKMSSSVPVGLFRTYVQLGPDSAFTFDAWSDGIRAGRTFITSGPMIRLTVDGEAIGSTLHVRAGATVEVDCEATSILPMHSLQLVSRGKVIDEVGGVAPARTLRLQATVRIDGPTWLAARCGGPGYEPLGHFDQHRRGIMAHTSPVYVATGAEYDLRDRATSDYMLSLVSAGREYLRSASPQYPAGTVTHKHGRRDHLAYLEEPFIEAEQRIRARRS